MPVGVAAGFDVSFFADSARSKGRLRAAWQFGFLAIALAASVPAASASCGDYVVIGNPSAIAPAHDAAAMPVAEAPQHTEQAPRAPFPCDGPS